MASARKKMSDTVREITRKALSGGKIDQAALRRVTGELRAATRAGKDAASQGIKATLASSAMAARAASGLLAGIADSLAAQKPRRKR